MLSAAMRPDSPTAENQAAPDELGGRVIRLRDRAALRRSAEPGGRRPAAAESSLVPDLAGFERAPEPDDYRQRMIVNAVALVFTVALAAAGAWLATSMADLRKNQDCALMGRLDCTQKIPANINTR
jgi:hypothetical protein